MVKQNPRSHQFSFKMTTIIIYPCIQIFTNLTFQDLRQSKQEIPGLLFKEWENCKLKNLIKIVLKMLL